MGHARFPFSQIVEARQARSAYLASSKVLWINSYAIRSHGPACVSKAGSCVGWPRDTTRNVVRLSRLELPERLQLRLNALSFGWNWVRHGPFGLIDQKSCLFSRTKKGSEVHYSLCADTFGSENFMSLHSASQTVRSTFASLRALEFRC